MQESDFLKIKLDFVKSIFTIVTVSFAGLISFLAINFAKNSVLLNCLTIGAVVILGFIFFMLIIEVAKIFKRMKGLIK